jgi:hypothetical protein
MRKASNVRSKSEDFEEFEGRLTEESEVEEGEVR